MRRKLMFGRKISSNPLDNTFLKNHGGREHKSSEDKVDLFLETFCKNFMATHPLNRVFERTITVFGAENRPKADNL